MNKVFLVGNLTHEPELRTVQSGTNVCSFSIAVNRRTPNAQGQREADFYRISAWRALGENCARYLHKGNKVAVVGDLTPRLFDGRDGTKQLSLDVQADSVEFLTSPSAQNDGQPAQAQAPQAAPRSGASAYRAPEAPAGMHVVEDDDLPF